MVPPIPSSPAFFSEGPLDQKRNRPLNEGFPWNSFFDFGRRTPPSPGRGKKKEKEGKSISWAASKASVKEEERTRSNLHEFWGSPKKEKEGGQKGGKTRPSFNPIGPIREGEREEGKGNERGELSVVVRKKCVLC